MILQSNASVLRTRLAFSYGKPPYLMATHDQICLLGENASKPARRPVPANDRTNFHKQDS